MNREVVIIHYNTPELTEAAILSLRKHGGKDYHVTILDNSDKRPFTKKMKGVKVVDNTKGQIIDFQKELEKFPYRDMSIGCAKGCEFGSDKHMMSVQKMWELVPQGFLLMESDILLCQDVDFMFQEDQCVVGHISICSGPPRHERLAPMLLYMNVPKCVEGGAKFFDPERTWALYKRQDKRCWWDTGAALLADIKSHRNGMHGRRIDIRPLLVHFGSGSWNKNDVEEHKKWLRQHIDLWHMPNDSVAICAIGRLENRYAVEWVEHYKKLGISKIFIYDNNHPEDGEVFADVLQPYIDKGLVEITKWEGVQKTAYEDCYNKHLREFGWFGFFDFDEFVIIEDNSKASKFLKGFNDADVVVMNWREMTDNGLLKYENKPVRERFTEAADPTIAVNRHTKCFVRGNIRGISFNDPHCPNNPVLRVVNVKGERVRQIPLQENIIHEIARVDHFDTKTADEYINIKTARGTCCGIEDTIKKRQNAVEYFFGINKRTAAKEKILGVSKPKKVKGTSKKGE